MGVSRLRCFRCKFTSACQQVFWMQRRKMCGILGRMRPSGTTILRRSMLRTSLMNAPLDMPAVCGLLCPPLHPSQPSLYLSVNTRQPEAVRPRVAGARNCIRTAQGIAAAGLPPSMNRGQKKTRINASAQAGYRQLEIVRLRRSCCRSLLLVNRFFGCREDKCAVSCMPCGGDDVEDVSHGRTPRHACRLRTLSARHSTHPQPLFWLQHTPTEDFEVSGGGSSKLQMDSPGHCCGRTPAVDESRAKENPHHCVCKSGLPLFGSFEAPMLRRQIHFCLSIVFLEKIERARQAS